MSTQTHEPAQPIPAQLSGSDTCTAVGRTAHGSTPVLAMCRELMAAGLNPDSALIVYRKGILALKVRSIAEGAGLEVTAKGVGFVSCAVRAASPVRLNAPGVHPRTLRPNAGAAS